MLVALQKGEPLLEELTRPIDHPAIDGASFNLTLCDPCKRQGYANISHNHRHSGPADLSDDCLRHRSIHKCATPGYVLIGSHEEQRSFIALFECLTA
jgi:hypothetical protein